MGGAQPRRPSGVRLVDIRLKACILFDDTRRDRHEVLRSAPGFRQRSKDKITEIVGIGRERQATQSFHQQHLGFLCLLYLECASEYAERRVQQTFAQKYATEI